MSYCTNKWTMWLLYTCTIQLNWNVDRWTNRCKHRKFEIHVKFHTKSKHFPDGLKVWYFEFVYEELAHDLCWDQIILPSWKGGHGNPWKHSHSDDGHTWRQIFNFLVGGGYVKFVCYFPSNSNLYSLNRILKCSMLPVHINSTKENFPNFI